MKKSKMLKLIKKELENWQDSKLTMKTAKTILDLMESLGMKPPSVWIERMEGKYINIWEEEK